MANQTQDPGCKDATAKIGFARTPDGLSALKKMFDNKGIHNEISEDIDMISHVNCVFPERYYVQKYH